MTKTAVLICPGRGTYNKTELGYLGRHHTDQSDVMAQFDAFRTAQNQPSLSALDGAAKFEAETHTRGDNASALIYAASYLDATAVSGDFEILAVTGNSMGWYTALAAAGAVSPLAGLNIVNTMGTLMHDHMIGGQTLYPFVDTAWQPVAGKQAQLAGLVTDINGRADHRLAVSIHLGGMLVVAGNEAGLHAFEASVPPVQGRYPMRLPHHAAFHTALQEPVAKQGRTALRDIDIASPRVPMVDGRGAVWHPGACTGADIWDYTLGSQVTQTYDFTTAVQVAAKTFAPDVFIITGPGTTLGGAVAQSLIAMAWQGVTDKAGFQTRQDSNDPLLIALGRTDQRALALQTKT